MEEHVLEAQVGSLGTNISEGYRVGLGDLSELDFHLV